MSFFDQLDDLSLPESPDSSRLSRSPGTPWSPGETLRSPDPVSSPGVPIQLCEIPISPIDGVVSSYSDVVRSKPRPRKNSYQKLPALNGRYKGFVTAIESALDYWIFIIDWPPEVEERYRDNGARHDTFSYINETSDDPHAPKYGEQYLCHLSNIQFGFYGASKEILTSMRSQIQDCNNYVMVTLGNIDIYNRILVEMFNIENTEVSYNKVLIETTSETKGMPLAAKYRPKKKYL